MTDITIMGAGIFGLSVAWACARRGARVQVVDPNGLAAGASGGIVGALAPHVPEAWNDKKAFQLDSLLMAPLFWQQVEDQSGLSAGYARRGRLRPLADARAVDLAAQRAQTARTLWQGQADWQVIETPAWGDWHPITPTATSVHDTLSALLPPPRASAPLPGALPGPALPCG